MYTSVGMGAPMIPRGYARRGRGVSGFGDTPAAVCPSLEQLMGITDPSDPCQTAANSGVLQTCISTATGSPVVTTCPISGVVQTSGSSQTGPFTTASLTTWLETNWWMLALGGLALFAIAKAAD
jgi:hypothetical protein